MSLRTYFFLSPSTRDILTDFKSFGRLRERQDVKNTSCLGRPEGQGRGGRTGEKQHIGRTSGSDGVDQQEGRGS